MCDLLKTKMDPSNFVNKDDCVSEGYLQNWYIDSVDESSGPAWTEEHIAELCQDFYIIPKEEK